MAKQLQFSLIVCLILATRCVYGEQKLYGLYSDELMSGELIIPKKVTATGEFVTHNLTHHHDGHSTHNRRRRSFNNYDNLTTSESAVYYQLQVKDEILHLDLEPNSYFLTPHVITERFKKGLRTSKPVEKNINCHYHGKIRGQEEDSRVALSACHGLVGHIKTKNNEYYIEPSKHHAPHEIHGHPHVIFQRSAVIEKPIKNSSKEADNRSQEHRGKPKQPLSNCGTKNPKRDIETELVEWQPEGKLQIQRSRKVRRPRNRHQKSQAKTIPPPPSSYANSQQRMKRSMPTTRYVETLVVADASMVAFHDDIETYIMVVMNIVAALFKDPSIGNDIEIIVVKIVLIHDQELLNIENKYGSGLNEFCSFQHKWFAINEGDPYHHDVAILITRNSLCGEDCGTMGMGNLGTMCHPRLSCSVTRDSGLVLANTIAHELGHNFGMLHDTEEIGCQPREGPIVHVMTPLFGPDTIQLAWSSCSREFITNFLAHGRGECLNDPPTKFLRNSFWEVQPGQRFDADAQCRFMFNATVAAGHSCPGVAEICTTLWCISNSTCISNMRPAAEGTSCGDRKVCKNGKCVFEGPLERIDGGWSPWSNWSSCSRDCGGGVLKQQRKCNNPLPQNGGSPCIGEKKRYQMCNVHECPKDELGFRAQQCAQYNNKRLNGRYYKWLPHIYKEHPCKLYCIDEDDTIIGSMQDKVLDGTPCKLGTNDVCIDGKCTKVGCDWIIDSDMQEDRCGYCGGQNEQCQMVKGFSNEDIKLTEGYERVLVLPAKARNIAIVEIGNSENFLAIAKANSSFFYLNGNSLINMPGEVIIAGAESYYSRMYEKDIITIPKAIEHSIEVYVVIRNNEPYRGLFYEFTVQGLLYNQSNQYLWQLSNWSSCSVSCGGGLQYREPICYENGEVIDDIGYCYILAENNIPLRLHQKCNDTPCPPHWITGPWQYCPVTCKDVDAPWPVKHRSVMCVDHNEIVLEEDKCDTSRRPTETVDCEEDLPICIA